MKKIITVFLSVLLAFGMFSMFAAAEDTPEIPEGFTPVYTKDDLDNIRLDMAGKYILMNDIVFTDADYAQGGDFYNSGIGWSAIGTTTAQFVGEFDGNGYGIYNLQINAPEAHGQGLFGYTTNAVIKNLTLSGNVTAKSYSGILLGGNTNNNVTVENCSVTGCITGSQNRIGGIIGSAYGKVNILNCHFSGSVTGGSGTSGSGTGGIVGYVYNDANQQLTIRGCLVEGAVSGTENVGGIAGYTTGGTNSTPGHSYTTTHIFKQNENRADITADQYAGGLFGTVCGKYVRYTRVSGNVVQGTYISMGIYEISDSFNRGSVTAATDYAGGICGNMTKSVSGSPTITNSTIKSCYNYGIVESANKKGAILPGTEYYTLDTTVPNYYIDTCIENPTNTQGYPKSEDQLKKQSTFQNWDFDTVWSVDKNAAYPYPTLNGISDMPEITVPNACEHVNTELRNAVDATCTEAGYSGDLVCLDCGKLLAEGEAMDALGHDYIDHPAVTPTCIMTGCDAYQTCSRCDYTSYAEKETDPNNHVNTRSVAETDSDCTTRGYTAGVFCNDCEQFISGHEEKPLGDHVWNNGEVIEPATCVETGTMLYTCTVEGCGETYEGEIPTDLENHKNTQTVAETTSSCTVPGYTAGVFCNDCGQFVSGHEEKPLAPHAWNEGEVIREATCSVKALVKYTCTAEGCNATKTEETVVDPENHDYIATVFDPTCTEKGYTDHTCSRCGNSYNDEYIVQLGHTDVNADGKCDRCGAKLQAVNDDEGSSPRIRNVYEFLIQFFKMLMEFFKGMFK